MIFKSYQTHSGFLFWRIRFQISIDGIVFYLIQKKHEKNKHNLIIPYSFNVNRGGDAAGADLENLRSNLK